MTDPAPRFGGAVLCGGSSRRMGTDKALLAVGRRPMALRVALALQGAGASPVVAVGGDRPALEALGLATVADECPGEGPLAAVATVLRAGRPLAIAPVDRARHRPEARPGDDAIVLVAACDLVSPSSSAFGATVRALAAMPAADAAVPVADGRRQWDQAAWRLRALPLLDAQLEQGERSIRRAVAASGLVVREVHGLDPAALADADTPDDLPGGPSRPG